MHISVILQNAWLAVALDVSERDFVIGLDRVLNSIVSLPTAPRKVHNSTKVEMNYTI